MIIQAKSNYVTPIGGEKFRDRKELFYDLRDFFLICFRSKPSALEGAS